MDPIAEIRGRLTSEQQKRAHDLPHGIVVVSRYQTGFDVELFEDTKQYIVTYGDGWHVHLYEAAEAVKAFLFGLNDPCRLRVTSRGSFDHKWTLEVPDDEDWAVVSSIRLLFFPYWRKKQVRFLQNH